MIDELKRELAELCLELFGTKVEPDFTRTEEQFGDYASNVALQLAGQLGKNPREIASLLAERLQDKDGVSAVEVAGPGFINIKLSDEALWKIAGTKPARPLEGQVVVAEYSDPNPFKILHAGHLYTSVVGDAIANLLENAGAEVHRVNFGGDVGLHVGKTMWAMLEDLGGENPDNLKEHEAEKVAWLATCYVKGNNAYEDNPAAKEKIIELNKRVYQIHAETDHDSPLARIYWATRAWSYEYFDNFYTMIGSNFEKYYPESSVAEPGLKTVKEHLGDVFEESNGAVVFDGEKYGLHTRVFINSEGLPTYEAKDVGLIMAKWNDYKFDRSIVITGNEQAQYMAVVLKALEQFEPKLAKATTHLTHGLVKLAGGVKMSSRAGNILGAADVLKFAESANKELTGSDDSKVSLGAVKYAFLKQRLGGDIIYDPAESVSIEGNSGPYLQYAHARACSILAKSEGDVARAGGSLDAQERSLLRKISEYPEAVTKAAEELMPHLICTYLYELAQEFNRFYEKSRIIDDPREKLRLTLVDHYRQTLADGLKLLGIEAPERM
jgi:arginyl-tRNA synthetase